MSRPKGPLLRLTVYLLLLLQAGACTASRTESQPRSESNQEPVVQSVTGGGGKTAIMPDEELTAVVPLVVTADVLSEQIVALRDDPFLPSRWEAEPSKAQLVRGGAGLVKWEVKITSWIKGTSASRIWVTRGTGGTSIMVESENDRFVISTGKKYRFWLEPHTWFGQDHWILVRAVSV